VRWIALIPVLFASFPAWAGGQVDLGRIEEAYFCEVTVNDGALAANEGIACNGLVPAATSLQTGVLRNAHVPTNRSLLIEDWGLIVTATLGATEVCDIDLMVDSTATGAGSSAGQISANDGGVESDCDEGATLDLDAAGETCTISNVNQLITGPGYYRFEFSGAACSVFQSGVLWVRGQFLP